jgi:hypothetical protein
MFLPYGLKNSGNEPRTAYRNTTIELKATKALAPQALRVRGFFCFPPAVTGWGKGEAATGQKIFPKSIFVFNLHLVLV